MANVIALAEKYLTLLDEVYQQVAKTAVLDAPDDMVREAEMADTIYLAKMAIDGLGDYARNSGHVGGDVDLSWEAHQFTQDRGRSFQVDTMDNLETAGVAFGRLSGEFLRSKVVPEIDAYRFATMFGKAGTKVSADLTATTALEAIDTGIQVMDDAEVPEEGRIIFVTPTIFKFLKQSDQLSRYFNVQEGGPKVNRNIIELEDATIVKVPQARFYSQITLYDGTTAGQEAGGYIKTATTGRDLNFLIIHPSAVLGIKKHVRPRIFDPETNQTADAWKFDYRIYHDLFVPDNKVDGIYAHNAAS